MNKVFILSLILTGFLFCNSVKAQESGNTDNAQKNKKWTVGYYSFNNEFGVSFLRKWKVYPEIRLKANIEDVYGGSFLLRTENHIDKKNNFDFSYGLGYSLVYDYGCYHSLKAPVYFVKNNIFAKNVNFFVGFEAGYGFGWYFYPHFSIKPGVGISFNF